MTTINVFKSMNSIKWVLSSILLLNSGMALAQPVNDNCANATVIAASSINGACINGTTLAATIEAFEGGTGAAADGCWDLPPDNTVWYRFTAPSTAIYTFGTSGGATDTQLKLLGGTCGAFTNIDCNEDWSGTPNGLAAVVAGVLTAGQTYYIQVDTWAAPGNFCLKVDSTSITNPAGTANDCIFSAEDITLQINAIDPNSNPFDCYVKTYAAPGNQPTRDNVNGPLSQCDIINRFRDRWYKFTITPSTPPVWIDVYRIGTLNYTAALYGGTPVGECGPTKAIGGLTYIDCSDGGVPGGPRDKGYGTTPIHSRIDCSNLAPGTYYYRVWQRSSATAADGTFSLCIEYGAPVGVTVDGCPPGATIGKTCDVPNTNVNETYLKLSNVGTTGNANNDNPNEPTVGAGTASGQYSEGCTGAYVIPIAYANNVINNTAIYSFTLNATPPCQAAPRLTFSNMEYGGTPGNVAQITVLNSVCGGGATSVMSASTNATCLTMQPYTGFTFGGYVPLANGTYYIVVDGQDGQLIQFDLNLEIKHVGVGCTASTGQPSQPIAMGATRCGPGSVTLSATPCVAGSTLKWYTQAVGGTAVATGSSFTTPSINKTTPYFVSCTVGTCESARTLVWATVTVPPIITAKDTTICSGSSYTIKPQPLESGGTYSWSPGGQTTQNITVSPTSTTNYTVSYTLNGCTGQATSVVTVNPIPSVTATNTAVCAGNPGTVTASGTPAGGTYLWSPGGETTASITKSPATTTSYTVTYSRNGCVSAPATATITVNSTATITASDPTICAGTAANITTVATPTGGTYSWSPGGQTTPGITVSPAATSNYTVTYTVSGCVATDVATVTVNPNPTVTSTNATICAGGSGTITATGSPAGGSYLWTPGGATTAAMTASPATTTTYNVAYTLNGCTGNGSGTITVQPAPTATMSGGGNICPGQTAPITVNFTGTGPWNLTYTNGSTSNTVSGITANPYTFNTGVAGTYSITNLSNASCSGTFSGNAVVTVRPAITISNQSAVCSAGNADYTVTFTISGGDPSTYAVTGMGGGTISAGPPYVFTSSPIPSGTTNYSFNVTDAANCNPVTVSGSKNCLCPTEAVMSGGGTICAGQTTTITITLTGTQPFNFTYTDGTTPTTINGHTTTSYTFTTGTAGNYSMVSVSDANACGGSVSGNAQVTVNPAPAYTVNNPTICNGETATITVSPSVSGGSYLWTAPASVAGQTTQSVNVTPATTTKYYMTYTLNGCSRNDSSLVTVNPIPTVTVNPTSICEGATATITTTVGTPGGTYLWNSPASVAGQTTASVTDNPAATQSYTVTYTLNGCSSQGTGTVTVNPTPIVGVTPATSTICAGTSVTLTASSTVTGGTYNWTPGGLTGSSITVSPTATTTYNVVHTVNGCPSNSAAATVNVNPQPTVSISDQTVCQGATATITAVPNPAGGTYNWTAPAVVAGQTTASVTDNPATDQAYSVTYTLNGCTATATGNVFVTPTPAITVSPNNPTICSGDPVTLSTTTTATGGTYNWTPGPQPTTSSITVSPTITTTYTVQQTIGTCASNTVSTTVTVNPKPTATASSNSPVCENGTLNLFGNTLAGATYFWSGPNSYTSTDEDPVILNAQASATGTYSLVITQNGCSSNPSLVSVVVNTVQDPTVTPAGPYCVNENPVNMTAASTGGTWSGTGITDATAGTFDPAIAGPGTHTITYNTGGACPQTATTDVIVNALPSITFNAPSTSACNPATIQFNSTISPAPSSVLWTFGDGGNSTSTSPNVSHSYITSGSYTVSLTATANGCSNTVTQNNYITINPTPSANFSAVANGTSVNLTNSSTGATTYEWDFGNGQTSTDQNPSVNYASGISTAVIELVATNTFGCTDTMLLTVELNEEVLYFIPNSFTPDGDPNNQYFLPVLASGIDLGSFRMEIFNRWGEKVFETRDYQVGWDGTFNNQLVPQGTYTWSIQFLDKNTDKRYKSEGTLNLMK